MPGLGDIEAQHNGAELGRLGGDFISMNAKLSARTARRSCGSRSRNSAKAKLSYDWNRLRAMPRKFAVEAVARAVRLLCSVAVSGTLGWPVVAAAQTVTEYAIRTANSSPWGITAGPDGALWFTETNTNKIGRITTAGVITEFATPSGGSGPVDITAGPDGAVWFTEYFANKSAASRPMV